MIRGAARLVLGIWLSTLAACSKRDDASTGVAGQGGPQLAFRAGAQKSESAPIALTTSDGAGLTLVSLEARTVIEDPLAFTELHLTFHNPEARRREGRFRITLPKNAAISRFAMRVGDDFQEGEVVERLQAQKVYEDFLHRKQDPALLENAGGNEFTARVFPIEASADKEIIVAYSEELAQRDEPYRLLVAGLPRLSHLKAEVLLGSNSATGLESSAERSGVTRLAVDKHDFAPGADLELRLPRQTPFALHSGNLVVARVRPMPSNPRQAVDNLTILFDTSASRALGYAAQIERLGELLVELARQKGGAFDVRVVAFDQGSEELFRGSSADFGLRDKGRLLAREALGATDLQQALTFLAEQPSAHTRLLLISDGMVTAGDTDLTRLREAVTRLSAHGITRLDVLAEGSVGDGDALAELTHAGLKTAGVVLNARADAAANAKRLLSGARDKVDVEIAGATWVYPRVLEGVQAGDERLVFAELPTDAPVQVSLDGGSPQKLRTLETPLPLLERAWARAKIAALTTDLKGSGQRDDSELAAKVSEIVALSKRQRVLSEYTALLVLEGDSDYQRFGIAQEALTSILRVGEEGLELFDRERRENGGQRHDQRPVAPTTAVETSEGARRAERAEPEPEPPTSRAQGAEPRRERAAPAEAEAKKSRGRAGSGELGSLGGLDDGAPGDVLAAAPAPTSAPANAAPAKAASSGGAPPASMGYDKGKDSAIGGSGSGAVVAREEVLADRPSELVPRAVLSLRSAEGIPQAAAASAFRSLSARARTCYAQAERREGGERLALTLTISERGTVRDVSTGDGNIADPRVQACLLTAARALQFPKPDSGFASVQGLLTLSMAAERPSVAIARPSTPRPRAAVNLVQPGIDDAYSGDLASVLHALRAGDTGQALALARAARERDPGDVLALVALGEVLEAQHELTRAARVYGSLIDLFPARADLRRMAGERIERLGQDALALATDSYRKAVAQRPDHPAGHRLLAYSLLKQGQRAQAFAALENALGQYFPADRFPGVERILREDLALVAAAWLRAEPDAKSQIEWALGQRSLKVDRSPSLRFVLNWETDANDVDFHIYDGHGGHASYLKPRLGSGGALYADITTGYGPECFAIQGAARAYPYVLQAHYFARGPMGYGMGKLQLVEHDGKGLLTFREAPFVIMKDKAFVELLRVDRPPS